MSSKISLNRLADRRGRISDEKLLIIRNWCSLVSITNYRFLNKNMNACSINYQIKYIEFDIERDCLAFVLKFEL